MRLKATPLATRHAPEPAPTDLAPSTPAHVPACPARRRRRLRDWLATIPLVLLLPALLLPFTTTSAVTSGSLIINQAELSTRPTSGAAWNALVDVARGSWGSPNLSDQDNQHGVRVFAGALVAARLDDNALRTKVKAAIMAAIGTERVGAGNSILALGRQLSAYVLAADVVDLSGSNDATFRTWLSAIRTRVLGGHSIWDSLRNTHESSANNWGAFAGASRIAASLYLGDGADVARAASVMRGFLGDRSAYASFRPFGSAALSWACATASATPVNPACTKSGINVDGAIIEDISRGGTLRWPPGDEGRSYTLESMQGLVLQAELLSRAGHPAWTWSSSALKRAAQFVSRYSGWNRASVDHHVPWLLNRRYGLGIPTESAGMGRGFGFTDWLYGPAGSGPAPTPAPTATATATPRPTATPTPAPTAPPTATPTATPFATPTGSATASPSAGATPSPSASATASHTPGPIGSATPTPAPTPTPVPTAAPTPTPTPIPAPPSGGGAEDPNTPSLQFVTTSTVPTSTVPLVVQWGPSGQIYELQERVNDSSYTPVTTGSTVKVTRRARSGYEYRYRVRARDGSDWTSWATSPEVDVTRLDERATAITYTGKWRLASASSYIGGKVKYASARGAKAMLSFTGRSVALIGPKGPTRGKAKIYIDGKYVKTVNLYSSTYRPRQIVFAYNWSKSAAHRLSIVVQGTAGHPMVAIDAMYTMR